MGRTRGRPSEGAREALIAAAHELFMERDYDHVSTEEILERSGVSRGALYHHFPTKLDLFRAVWEASERRAIERIAGGGAGLGSTPVRGPRSSSPGATCGRPRPTRRCGGSASARAAAVLGWEALARGGDRARDRGRRSPSVSAAIEAGELPPDDPETMAIVLLGAMIEAAMLIVVAEDPAAARETLARRWSSTCSRACADSIARRCRRRSKSRTRSSSSTATR